MQLSASLWSALSHVVNWLTMSPVGSSELRQQQPILGEKNLVLHNKPSHYPIFKPPTGRPKGPGAEFQCLYPEMRGWVECSTPENRGCWLRHPDGREFNILTPYETQTPTGVPRDYTLIVADGEINADGMVFPAAKMFNATFPGPWIQACWGDTVNVKVINKLQYNGTSIHWHGIRQFLSMQMDGVNGVTQCPIAPGDSFTYSWNVTQYGSSWYHSHYSVQYADGVQGPITLHGPSSASFDEPKLPILLTDWGHDSAFVSVDNEQPVNQSILLNGRGNITRFNNTLQNLTSIPDIYQLHFEEQDISLPGRAKRYLLRIINTSFDSTFIFSIDNHWLQIVESDFVPVEPFFNTSVLIGIGQRYHVIVEADPAGGPSNPIPEDGNFWIRTWVADGCGTQGSPGYEQNGVLRYDKSSTSLPTSKAWTNVATECSNEEYASLRPVVPWFVGSSANGKEGQQFDVTLNTSSQQTNLPFPLALFSLQPENSPPNAFTPIRVNYSDPTFLNLNNFSGKWPDSWVVVPEDYTSDDWVYLVLAGGGPNSTTYGAHPIHLHGHDFAILQQVANDTFSPEKLKFKLDNPPRRDVVLLPANGWVAIAFKADNPGNWLMHCHIAYHISYGLGLQILERQKDANALWPPNSPAVQEAARVCANWNTWYSNCSNWWHNDDSASLSDSACPGPDPLMYFQKDSGV